MKQDELHIKSGMSVPEGYFEKSYKQLSDELALRSMISDKQEFSVPDDYFANAEKRILEAVANKPKVRKLSVWRYVAASAAILVATLTVYKNVSLQDHFTDSNSLTNKDIENYINESPWGNNFYWLSEQVQNSDVDFTADYTISDSEIEQYLNDYAYLNDYDY
ncbi:MAG: hypothetical protein Q4G08_07895 [Capnocytophaga sp.]|nr:hypothetical protein [Capnocytophaga sp.]